MGARGRGGARGRVGARGVELAAEIAANAPLSLAGNKRVIALLLEAGGALGAAAEAEAIALREASCARRTSARACGFAGSAPPRWQGR